MAQYQQLFIALFSAAITIGVFVFHARCKEQRAAAITMFKELMTSETLLRARLVTQEYLVPGIDRSKFARFYQQNFDQINEALEISASAEDKAARFCIRAIPSFFWMVDEAAKNGYIPKNQLFSRIYSYYYVMVIEPRRGNASDPFYRKFDWMLTATDEAERRTEYAERLAAATAEKALNTGVPRV